MDKKGIPLESFNLDEREFERSKNWSALIKRYSINDSGDEVDLDNLESHYADGNDEEDESAEDLVEVDLEDEENEPDPLDQSVIQMRIFSSTLLQGKESRYKNFKYSGSKLMVPLPEEEEEVSEEDQCELQNILDQTIPKLEERKRKWKESGMLRVLNTFDEEKIERTVGSWLRVNNSRTVQSEKRTRTPQTQYDDEDDSLHSMETARYVLSNRKPRSSRNSHNTMTIKRYRQLQSKRDALHEKYALPEDELERIRAISKQKLRRHASDISTQLARFIKTKVLDKESAARKTPLASECERSCVKKRRKLLNKHRGRYHLNQSSWNSSSSDEDFGDNGNDQCSKNPWQRQQRRLHRASRVPYCRRSQILTPLTFSSTISSMHSSTSDTETRSLICNQPELRKPKKRASECCCYNKKKLCHQIDHLADTSTEDWLVENCDSPKKLVAIDEVKNPVQPIKKPKSTSKMKARKNEKCIRNNKNAELIGDNEKDIHETEENKQDEESGNNSQLDSTFERELKLAVELSKQSYKAEVNQLKDDKSIDRKAKKSKARKVKNKKKSTVEDDMASIPIKALRKREPKKMSTKMGTKSSTNGPTDSLMSCEKATTGDQSEKTLETFENSCKKNPEIQEIVIKPNANVPERNENVFLNAALVIHEISPTQFGIKPQPKSLKIKKVKKILEKSGHARQKEDETFFTRADKICNSTAVPDDTVALKKQFPTVADTPSEQSTKPETLIHDEVMATKIDNNKDATLEDDADDCFVVTSTTEEPQQKAEAAGNVTNNRSNNSNEGMKDIMLYTPRCRNLAPTSSISDGVFNITEEHLSTFIGTKSARKFMKYYIGRRRFDANLTVYYRPPRDKCLDSNNDTDSDVEELEQLNRYGELYASFEEENRKVEMQVP